ncbi:MAG: DMT family transporter [Bosea sp. (in: a-proteobacteria)]|jgi:drug/metabolite transporter (DMT)-like permease
MSAPRAGLVARMAAMPPVLMATLGIFLLTGMDAVVKAQMQTHPVVVSIFLRFVMGGLVAFVALAWLAPPRPTGPEIRANLLRVPLVVLTAGSFFYSISQLPLAEAISLSFLAPAFIAVLGVVLLKEKLDRNILLALAAGFAGMLVMLLPKLQEGITGSTLGVIAALFSACAYAFNIILLRRLAVNQHPATIVAFQNWGPAVLLLPAAVWFWSSPDRADLAMFLLSGLLGTSGHLLLTYAFSRANASRLAPTEYTSLVWAAIIGFTMFGEVPTLYTFAGAALIVLGAFTLARR